MNDKIIPKLKIRARQLHNDDFADNPDCSSYPNYEIHIDASWKGYSPYEIYMEAKHDGKIELAREILTDLGIDWNVD